MSDLLDIPPDFNQLRSELRLEVLVHALVNQLSPATELVTALRLQSNASVTTRGKLEHLVFETNALRQSLDRIQEQAVSIRAAVQQETTR